MQWKGIRMRGFMAAVAGADRSKIGDSWVERARYQGTGAAIILASCLGFLGMLLMMAQVTDGFRWWQPLVAVFWALIVFNLDRLLVSSFHYGKLDDTNDGQKPKGSWYGQIAGFVSRILLALLIAYSVAEPAMLVLFKQEIDQYVTQIQQDDADAHRKEILQSPGYTQKAAAIEAVYKQAVEREKTTNKEVKRLQDIVDGEANGSSGSGIRGCESICEGKQAELAKAKTTHDTAEAQLKVAVDTRKKDLDGVQKQQNQDIADATKTTLANKGFLARSRALDKAIDAKPELAVRRWTLTALLIFVDLLPVLLKIFSPLSLHDWRVRRQVGRDAEEYNARLGEERFNADQGRDEIRNLDALDRQARLDKASHDDKLRRDDLDHEFEVEKRRRQRAKELRLEEIDLVHAVMLAELRRKLAPTMPNTPQGPLVLNSRWQVTVDGPPGAEYGGIGETRIALDLHQPGVEVVVKRVRSNNPNVGIVQRVRERFLKEIERQLAMTSDYVARILDHGDHPTFGDFLVLPLFPDTLARRQALTYPEPGEPPRFVPTLQWVLNIIEQTLIGLRDCLDEGILHLDVKPANIALDHGDIVRLIDFGLAKEAPGPGVAQTALIGGFTPQYTPPEQARGTPGWISSSCDVRAVGATFYELVTGLAPFVREATGQGMYPNDQFDPSRVWDFIDLVEFGQLTRPRTLVPALPPAVDDLIMRWLTSDVQLRTPDVRVAVDEFDQVSQALSPTDLLLEVGLTRTNE